MSLTIPVEYVPSKYRCCGCFHVRTGTLLLAVLQIVVHFIVLAILTAALGRATHFRDDVEYVALSISVMSFIQWERFVGSPEKPTALPKADVPSNLTHTAVSTMYHKNSEESTPSITKHLRSHIHPRKFFIKAGEEYIAIAVTLLSLLFSIMMLMGTIYARPYYLLPYCCVQFVDLFVSCLSVVGYYTYLPESGTWTRAQLILSLVVILAGIVLLALKAYMIAMVWLCYKFLLRYSSGLERVSGFSLVSGSWCFPISLCGRLGCVQQEFTGSSSTISSEQADVRTQIAQANRTPGRTRRIIVLLRRPSTIAGSPRTRLVEPCLPPKYEDALMMPSGAYDPPPYDLLTGENTTHVASTTVNELHPETMFTCETPETNQQDYTTTQLDKSSY